MRFYQAPMEGVAGIRFRKIYHEYFGDADRYFTPFLVGLNLSHREKEEVSLENNTGMELVPQILSNRAQDFIYVTHILHEEYGYSEVNLNLGCPSGTVASKNRGSGFLRVLDELERFLDEIYAKSPVPISIKTRIGVENSEDWDRILTLYRKYPLSELIVHPRTMRQAYSGLPDLEAFALAYAYFAGSGIPLCYNGNVNSIADYEQIISRFPKIDAVMCGRGLVKNPYLLGELKGRPHYNLKDDPQRFRAYIKATQAEYKAGCQNERNFLFKLKELWKFWAENFDDAAQVLRRIQKSTSYLEYEAAVNQAFRSLT